MTDNRVGFANTTRTKFYSLMEDERDRQDQLHPNQGVSAALMLVALMEEVGEVAEALIDDGPTDDHFFAELVEVAAVALRIYEMAHAGKFAHE